MAEQFMTLPLALLTPDPQQPRRELESDNTTVTEAHTLQGLADSIREVGILQPIRVRALPAAEGVDVAQQGAPRYMIVSGQRRYEAAKMLGLSKVPCLVVDESADASKTLVSQLAENLQRKAMTASELALAVQSLVQSGATQAEVAQRLGIPASQVTLLLNLLQLASPVKAAFERGRIESPRAAYDLNKLPTSLQTQLIAEADRKERVITQRDVREVKLLNSKQMAQARPRYEPPEVSVDEYSDFLQCIQDGIHDEYDPTDDCDAVFGPEWRTLYGVQTGQYPQPGQRLGGADALADTVDAIRVRVPGFTLTRDQCMRLYAAMSWTPPSEQLEDPAALGRELARLLSEV